MSPNKAPESSNGQDADGSNPVTGPSGSVKVVYRDGAVTSIEIDDPDHPMIKHSISFFLPAPCEHTRREMDEFWSKWSKFLPVRAERAAPNERAPEAPPDEGRQDPEAAHASATAYTLHELRRLACACRRFADISKRMKQCEDPPMSVVLFGQWNRGAQRFAKTLSLRRFIETLAIWREELAGWSGFPQFCKELLALHHRWTLFAAHSKLNKIDWPCSSLELLKGVDPLFDGHEAEYRGFRMNGTRLLHALDAIDSFLDNRRGIPVATETATNGHAPEAPADHAELVTAAPPSGNGTNATEAATNGHAPEAPAVSGLTPAARVLASAYDLDREGRPVSLRSACERARVDRANLKRRYPEAVKAIRKMARPDRNPRRGFRDRRTGNIDALDDRE